MVPHVFGRCCCVAMPPAVLTLVAAMPPLVRVARVRQFTGADLSAVASNALQLALRRRVAEIEARVGGGMSLVELMLLCALLVIPCLFSHGPPTLPPVPHPAHRTSPPPPACHSGLLRWRRPMPGSFTYGR